MDRRRRWSFLLASSVLLATVACGGDDDGPGSGVDSGTPPRDSGTGGGFDGGGTTGGDGGGTVTRDGSTGGFDGGPSVTCGISLSGTACSAGETCTWMESCNAGSCTCSGGTWACMQTSSCGTMCPMPTLTGCGDACEGDATGCLCRCGGGGPDFTPCNCVGGSWMCSGSGGCGG